LVAEASLPFERHRKISIESKSAATFVAEVLSASWVFWQQKLHCHWKI